MLLLTANTLLFINTEITGITIMAVRLELKQLNTGPALFELFGKTEQTAFTIPG